MSDALVLCGGTGAHVGLAFLRFHTLGFALGFFDREAAERRRSPFPKIYLVDQDAGDGESGDPTAWQLARRFVELHPGRFDWQSALDRSAAPELVNISPLPVGANNGWYRPPHNVLERRFENSPLLPVLAAQRQRQIDYSKGMMGSPAIGSLLFKLKEYDEVERAINQDKTFGQLLAEDGRLVVAGSGIGGTGASVAPTLALRLAERPNRVMAVMVLNWFFFDEEDPDSVRRGRAALRNRILKENANSALEFYGQALAQKVAALPVGIPESAQLKRAYTGDVGQPKRESFVHAVAALGALRHLLHNQAYGPGLYAMGAVDRGRLEGGTGIPGGTLQDLANQAATLAEMLDAWRGVLGAVQSARVIPALHSAFRRSGFDPAQVARHLEREVGQFREHLEWLEDTLGIVPQPYRGLTRELEVRRRLAETTHSLPLREGMRPEEAPFALFRWTADWIREIASTTNGLEILRQGATGVYWPDTHSDGIGVAAGESGGLTRVPDQNIAAVLESFVDRDALSANGWPHPLAAADYFRHAIERRDPVAVRQLELLLVGLLVGRFEPRPLWPGAPSRSISLEFLTSELRREGFPSLAEIGLYDRARDGVLIGFSSPHTLLCPVPYMDDEADHRTWQEIWTTLTGSTDGASWQNAKADWSGREREARQARAWIEDLKRRRGGVPPPWTRAFEGLPSSGAPRWGAGHRIEVYWGTSGGEQNALIWLELPTRDASDRWSAPAGAGTIDLDEFERRVPELAAITEEAGVRYERFSFQKPGRPLPVEAIWREHLDALQRQEKIYRWTKNERGELIIALLEGDQVRLATLAGVEVLAIPEISILECVPWVQDPVPGSDAPGGGVRFPDLPLKTEYLDLALSAENGESLKTFLEHRRDLRSFQSAPGRRIDAQGRLELHWDLRLQGRSTPAACEIRLEGKDGRPFEASQTAHLMVWPNFRDPARAWKAYYVYFRCSNLPLGVDVVWLDSGARLGLRASERATDEPFPVGYTTGEKAGHSAGPPIAVAIKNFERQRDLGLYLVPLKALPPVKVDVQLAIDFGTSHTVAAFTIGDRPAHAVDLLPELQAGTGERCLTCHLSEDWAHVTANEKAAGLLATAAWLPTYRAVRDESLLPSELLLTRTIRDAQSQAIADWRPLTDYTIPPLDISRSDLGDYLLADFKWNAGSEEFRGREPELRGCYLGLFLEMVAAEVVAHQLRGLTERPIPLTFTYPLRVSEPDLKTLQETLRTALERAQRSLGLRFMLKGNEGLYDESRAARLDTKKFGDLCVVGDLGGGTLDLYIAANNGDQELRPVADSARLGGNLLLHQLADPEGKFLPADGHWFTSGSNGRDTETKLRAWMRSEGSGRLFGVDAGGRPEMKALGLVGFAKPAESARARKLIDRYFRLIIEYMARSLVGFLIKQWYPNVEPESWDRLRITVQLRGNGWRLQYDRLEPIAVTRNVQDAVRKRVIALWSEAPENPFPAPESDQLWEPPSKFEIGDAKTAPIRSVLGRAAMPVGAALGNWYTHTLVNLEVQRANRKFLHVPWTESVPFSTGGSTQIQIREVEPPLPLSSANADQRSEIRELDARQQGRINASLQEEEGALDGNERLRAPVGALVWEAVFDSRSLWP